MSQEEGMSWSMPPEEILTYAVPGFFGLSRQEGGDVPAPGQVFYWGRMHFTQTNDYLGLLPGSWCRLSSPDAGSSPTGSFCFSWGPRY